MSKQALNEQTVIRRAAELADAEGFATVTLSAVARSLEIQPPSLYSHVRDLGALRDGITVLALGELADAVAEEIGGRSRGEALRGYALAHRQYMNAHPGRWDSLQRRSGSSAARTPAAARIARVTQSMLHGYDIPERDRVHATRLVASMLNGFLTLERTGSFDHSEPAADESWGEILRRLDSLLAQW